MKIGKKLLIFILLVWTSPSWAQKYFTKVGQLTLRIETSAGGVVAHNEQTYCTLDFATGEIVLMALVKGFEFRRAAVKERFNYTYAESDKFPKIIYKGKIKDFDKINLRKNGSYSVQVNGNLNFHNINQTIQQTGTVEVKGKQVIAQATFRLKVDDFKLNISKAERQQIKDYFEVKVSAICNPVAK
ncbi:MAG: YceI family protein [Microscillaceae bacterium]|jgi:hypothetical protein|nr:YceI family protein [Microscillaceae bacterium]